MPKYSVKQTVDYWAEGIEADSPEEALEVYLEDQDSYYNGVVSEEVEEEESEEGGDE
jgi:hypothetical protein